MNPFHSTGSELKDGSWLAFCRILRQVRHHSSVSLSAQVRIRSSLPSPPATLLERKCLLADAGLDVVIDVVFGPILTGHSRAIYNDSRIRKRTLAVYDARS